MSNYDQTGCSDCGAKTDYAPLQGTTYNECGPTCIDRNNKERSVKDTMYFNHFVQNKSWNLKPYQPDSQWLKHTFMENNNL
uniref:Uncharacterized protein n=1 Tax=viral metagenome TaxID=1070528 RepID=A0A6C0EJS5_9ZZZZ